MNIELGHLVNKVCRNSLLDKEDNYIFQQLENRMFDKLSYSLDIVVW